jgi:hypothetical protein
MAKFQKKLLFSGQMTEKKKKDSNGAAESM